MNPTTNPSALRRPRSLFALERMRSDKRVTWLTLAGLVLVPLVIGGLLVWALWNPTERLDRVSAAVVNLDQPVQLNGQTVPLGRQLAAGLLDTESDNFAWVLTDADDAKSGVADGNYVAVVTIPKNFSQAATSTAGDANEATQATIDVRTSQKSRLVDPAISQAVTTAATSVLNKQLTSTYLENVYLGFNTLHDQIGQAATGASQLAGGVGQLASGTHQLSDAAAQLATGASSLAGGLGPLSDGTAGLAGGLGTLSTNMNAFADGMAQLQQSTQDLPQQTAELNTGMQALTGSLSPATTGINSAMALCATPTSPEMGDLCRQIGAQLVPLNTANAVAEKLAPGVQQLAAGTPALADGIAQSATGANALAGGAAQSASGAGQLASGASQSASGAASLADGIGQLAGGLAPLATGADQSAAGAVSLATGLDSAAAQLPTYDETERTNLASVASQPVTTTDSGNTSFGTSSIPLFASVALWLGALATFLVLQPLSRRALLTSRAAGLIALDGFLPAAALGALQGVLVAGIMQPAMQLELGAWLGFAAVAVLTGVTFAALNHGFVALLGGSGRFLSMLIVVLTLAAGIVSTVPGFFDGVMPWLPTAPAITALQGVVDGTSGLWRGLGGMLLWAALGFGLALAAVARRRIVTAAQLLPAE